MHSADDLVTDALVTLMGTQVDTLMDLNRFIEGMA